LIEEVGRVAADHSQDQPGNKHYQPGGAIAGIAMAYGINTN